jgi:hypothetical protein
VTSTNYGAPHYAVFSIKLILSHTINAIASDMLKNNDIPPQQKYFEFHARQNFSAPITNVGI